MGAAIRPFTENNSRSTAAAAVLLMLILLLAGCGPLDMPISGKGLAEPAPIDRSIPAITHRLHRRTELQLPDRALWEKTYEGAAAAAVTPDGGHVIIHGHLGTEGVGFEAFDRHGELLWRRLHRTGSFTATNTAVGASGGDPLFVLMVHDHEQLGTATVVDGTGKALWSRKLEGISSVIMSSDTERLAFIDYLGGTVVLTDRRGRELGSFPLARGGSAVFLGDTHSLLIYDSRAARIVDGRGRLRWERSVEGGGDHQVLVSPESLRISVATAGADSAIYMFNHRGQLLWNYLLMLGGTNRLSFGPDDDTLYVYNVGEHAGVYVFGSDDGELLWRASFDTGSRSRLTAEQFRVRSEGGSVVHIIENGPGEVRWPGPGSGLRSVARLSEARGTIPDTPGDRHSLVILDGTGSLEGYIPLGPGSRVELSADGMGAVVSRTYGPGRAASEDASTLSPGAPVADDIATEIRFIGLDSLLYPPGSP